MGLGDGERGETTGDKLFFVVVVFNPKTLDEDIFAFLGLFEGFLAADVGSVATKDETGTGRNIHKDRGRIRTESIKWIKEVINDINGYSLLQDDALPSHPLKFIASWHGHRTTRPSARQPLISWYPGQERGCVCVLVCVSVCLCMLTVKLLFGASYPVNVVVSSSPCMETKFLSLTSFISLRRQNRLCPAFVEMTTLRVCVCVRVCARVCE